MRVLFAGAVAGAVAAVLPAIGEAACDAQSGPATAALVELYTSEGCSSCPPADRQFGRLPQALGTAVTVVPLALHVGYWDDLGWKDRYAQDAFARRQKWRVGADGGNVVYTPQLFLNGREAHFASLAEGVRSANAQQPAASLHLQARPEGADGLAISATAWTGSAAGMLALYVAVAENGLVSKVTAGENGGATLQHDHVVRLWLGPLSVHDGSTELRRTLQLPPDWNRARLEISAFVEDQRSGRVLQAVSTGECIGIAERS